MGNKTDFLEISCTKMIRQPVKKTHLQRIYERCMVMASLTGCASADSISLPAFLDMLNILLIDRAASIDPFGNLIVVQANSSQFSGKCFDVFCLS